MKNAFIDEKYFEWGKRTYIMGILNRTPDSFSDGGRYLEIETATEHVMTMISEGADIIDIGGESTRPNAVPIDSNEEIDRVVPLIEEISKKCNVPISIDTYHAKTAEAAIKAGATFVNDVWGLKADPDMPHIVAQYGVLVCLMHNRKTPDYENFIDEVKSDLYQSIRLAVKSGVKEKNIILDPGVGFGKTYEQNIQIMKNLGELKQFGFPVLLGVSRKSIIGLTLNVPLDERVEGTIAANVLGIVRGVDIIRVHDIRQNKRAATMIDRMVR